MCLDGSFGAPSKKLIPLSRQGGNHIRVAGWNTGDMAVDGFAPSVITVGNPAGTCTCRSVVRTAFQLATWEISFRHQINGYSWRFSALR